MIRSLLLAAFPLLLAAETPGPYLRVPVLGYIFDASAKTIRKVSGVPGAAGLDQPVAVGKALDAAWIHSGARIAVAVTKDAETAVVNWGEAPHLTVLSSSLGTPVSVAFSASGDRAVLTDSASIEIWSELAGHPSKTATRHPQGGVVAIAVRADGAVAVATGSGNILRFSGDEEQMIAAGGSWSALAFEGNVLLAADAQHLVRIADTGGRTVIADLPAAAAALAVSADTKRVAVALDEGVMVIDLTGAAVPVACGCRARHLEALEGNLVVSLAGTENGSLVLDADSAPPRVLTLTVGSVGGVAQ